jgi:heme A synthase
MALCATDTDCASLVTGHWCAEAATCDATLGACVVWPRCRVTPWIGCAELASPPQCVMARGPDGPREALAAPGDQITPVSATAIVGAILLALALLTMVIVLVLRRRARPQ